MTRNRTLAVLAACLIASAFAAYAAEPGPLEIAKQGYIYAGGKYVDGPDGKTMQGQAYVEYQIPQKKTQPYPIVMIHGGGQNGSNFTGTPDGREGWAQYFLRQGYAVYVVDQVGRGRSPLHPSYGETRAALDELASRSDSPRPSARNCGRRPSGTRNGREPASPAIRRSISSMPSRCRRWRAFRNSRS